MAVADIEARAMALRARRPEEVRGPQFIRADELVANVKPIAWTIRHVLEHGSLACLYGEAEAYKTFAAVSMALSIATGLDWHGNKVTQGAAFYLCGEGRTGIARRLKAWAIRNARSLDGVPLYVHPVATDLADQGNAQQIGEAVAELARSTKLTPRLIVVDTLSRHLAADENSSGDMARFISNLDTLVREPTGAAVLVVHHSGHGSKDRARGSSVLRAALDSEFRATKTGDRSMTLEGSKAKDHERMEAHHFALNVVELGLRDDEGRELTSLVLDRVSEAPSPDMGARGKHERAALEALQQLNAAQELRLGAGGHDPAGARVTIADWRAASKLDRRRWPEVFKSLADGGRVRINHPYVECVKP